MKHMWFFLTIQSFHILAPTVSTLKVPKVCFSHSVLLYDALSTCHEFVLWSGQSPGHKGQHLTITYSHHLSLSLLPFSVITKMGSEKQLISHIMLCLQRLLFLFLQFHNVFAIDFVEIVSVSPHDTTDKSAQGHHLYAIKGRHISQCHNWLQLHQEDHVSEDQHLIITNIRKSHLPISCW